MDITNKNANAARAQLIQICETIRDGAEDHLRDTAVGDLTVLDALTFAGRDSAPADPDGLEELRKVERRATEASIKSRVKLGIEAQLLEVRSLIGTGDETNENA